MNCIFENKFCLNLDRRPDRWEKAQAQFNSVGFEVKRFSAIDGPLLKDKNPELAKHFNPKELGIWPKVGLMKSWESMIDISVDNKSKNLTVFEDDLEFCENFKDFYNSALKSLPEKWDIIFFANNRITQTDYSPPQSESPILAASGVTITGLHFVSVNERAFPRIKKYLSNGINITRVLNDRSFARYYSSPSLACQVEGYSDIREANLKRHEI